MTKTYEAGIKDIVEFKRILHRRPLSVDAANDLEWIIESKIRTLSSFCRKTVDEVNADVWEEFTNPKF